MRQVEWLLDVFEAQHASVAVACRLRPGLMLQARGRQAEIRRYFAGPLLPNASCGRAASRSCRTTPRLRFQACTRSTSASAYRARGRQTMPRAGAYNVAAEPVLDPERLASLLGARRVPVPARVLRAAAALTWRARLQPTPEGWVDMALGVPIMDTTRAHEELGWEPRHGGGEALLELLGGMADGDGYATPPLHAGRLALARAGAGRRRSALGPVDLGVGHAVGAGVRLGLCPPGGIALRVAEDHVGEHHERLVGSVEVDVPARLVEDRGERVGQRGRSVVGDLEEQQRPA
jgi:hypothetical protein